MSAVVIDGKAVASRLKTSIAAEVAAIVAKGGERPGLAVILVGDDPASQVYVASKHRQMLEVGMLSFDYRLPADATQDAVLSLIQRLNTDEQIDGILVQLPLPSHLDEAAILAEISPDKDVDGFHIHNAGRLATGQAGTVPCTPLGCAILLREHLGDLSGLHAVVVGRSNIVGKPMAQLLLAENCTVTVAHSRTRDLAALVRQADIVVAAVGRPQMIKGAWLKPGATVIDVGINRIPAPERGEGQTRLVGDVEYPAAVQVADAITPVPGGVGPMTIACLLQNTLTAYTTRQRRLAS